jgi:hypothetical protein
MMDSPKNLDILDRIALEAAVAKLKPMQQEIVHMYFWQDRSLDEIGKVLGPKYRGKKLTGSAIRYYLKYILLELGILLDID